jgi:ATP-binding cassette, subfamily F, member 3
MRAKDVLLTALQEYSGTLVFVSHDRYFIDRLATRIFEIEEGCVTVYPGNYEDYLWRKEGHGPTPDAGIEREKPEFSPAEPAAVKPPEKRLNPIKLQRMQERRQAIEEQVTRLEAEIAGYEAALGNFVSAEETRHTSELLESRRSDLKKLMGEWEEVAQLIEAQS